MACIWILVCIKSWWWCFRAYVQHIIPGNLIILNACTRTIWVNLGCGRPAHSVYIRRKPTRAITNCLAHFLAPTSTDGRRTTLANVASRRFAPPDAVIRKMCVLLWRIFSGILGRGAEQHEVQEEYLMALCGVEGCALWDWAACVFIYAKQIAVCRSHLKSLSEKEATAHTRWVQANIYRPICLGLCE